MSAPTDVRDRIIAWLDCGGSHESDCGYWPPGGTCDCDKKRLSAAVRAVLDMHKPRHDGPFGFVASPYCSCPMLPAYPCATVRAVADALGVST